MFLCVCLHVCVVCAHEEGGGNYILMEYMGIWELSGSVELIFGKGLKLLLC